MLHPGVWKSGSMLVFFWGRPIPLFNPHRKSEIRRTRRTTKTKAIDDCTAMHSTILVKFAWLRRLEHGSLDHTASSLLDHWCLPYPCMIAICSQAILSHCLGLNDFKGGQQDRSTATTLSKRKCHFYGSRLGLCGAFIQNYEVPDRRIIGRVPPGWRWRTTTRDAEFAQELGSPWCQGILAGCQGDALPKIPSIGQIYNGHSGSHASKDLLKETVKFMVTDSLEVFEASTVKAMELMKAEVRDFKDISTTTVTLTETVVKKLILHSMMGGKHVLTDLFPVDSDASTSEFEQVNPDAWYPINFITSI